MQLQESDVLAAAALWPALVGTTPRLINYSENHTFRFDTPDMGSYTLRVHRPDYQSVANIESELAWLAAIRRDTDLPVPEPIPGSDGHLLQSLQSPDGQRRYAVLFRFIPGAEPSAHSDLSGLFSTLGNYAARLHEHTIAWRRPSGFERQAWNAATILNADGLWGDWRIAPGVTSEIATILRKADSALRSRLGRYGIGRDRYGLIHADMRLGNLLVDADKVSLIDFDDCGLCWFGYDFAAAISFYETAPEVPALRAAWLDGYLPLRRLGAEDIAAIDSMVLLRRMALLAWMGTHSETTLAQTHVRDYAEGSAGLAERYLAGPLWPL